MPSAGSSAALPARRSPHDRDILRLALPAFGALVAEPLYRLTDTAVVGHLGTDELAGLTLANAVLATRLRRLHLPGLRHDPGVARLIGAGEHERAAHQAVQSLWLAVGARRRAGRAARGRWPTRWSALLGGEGAVADHAAGLPPDQPARACRRTFVILAGTGYLRGLQDTRTPLVVAVGTAVVNLVLEVWWIYGLDFGIGASALSTVVAEVDRRRRST